MNVLVLAPHTDDAEIGCGGTIARMTEEGHVVRIVAFSDARKSLLPCASTDATRKEQRAAAEILGATVEILDFETRVFPAHRQEILEKLVNVRDEYEPDLVLAPSRNDWHQDHAVIANEAARAFRRCNLLGYECQGRREFNPTFYVETSRSQLKRKLNAIRCYNSQSWRGDSAAQAIHSASLHGASIGAEFAEAFEVYQWIL